MYETRVSSSYSSRASPDSTSSSRSVQTEPVLDARSYSIGGFAECFWSIHRSRRRGGGQTRGFRALKLWVTLAHAGTSGLKQQIARQIALARYLEQRVETTPNFELRSRGKLSIVCFRYVRQELQGNEEALDALNKKIMERMQADGTAFLTNTMLAGRFVLRACILHYGTTERDIDAMVETVHGTAMQVMNQ